MLLNKSTKKIGILLFLIIFCLSFRFYVLRDFQNIGHNWDWGFPASNLMFRKIVNLSTYAWNGSGLGVNWNLQAHLVPNSLVSIMSYFVKFKIIVFFVMGGSIALAFVSFKKFVDYVIEKNDINYIASILYAFSPFLFNDIIGGSWYMWISYAFAPIFALSLVRYVIDGGYRNVITYLISGIFVISSLQNFVLLEIIVVLFLLGMVFIRKYKLKNLFKRYVIIQLSFSFFNLYWIIPFVSTFGKFYSFVTDKSFTGGFEAFRRITQDIQSILMLSGYLDRNMYSFAIPENFFVFFYVVIFGVWMAFISCIFLEKENSGPARSNLFVWMGILLFLMIIIKGGVAPFAELTMKIFQNFPLMSLYRSPQHLMLAASFIVSIILSLSLVFFSRRFNYKVVLALSSFVVAVWTFGWWYNGDLGHDILSRRKRDFADFYDLSPYLHGLYEFNELSKINHRLVFLPTSFSPWYLDNEYQNKAQGGQPEYMYLKNYTFSSENNFFANEIDNKFCDLSEVNWINLLSITNSLYVSNRNDIVPAHTKCAIYDWDYKKIQNRLNEENEIYQSNNVKGEFLFRVKDNNFLPHFYTPVKNIVSGGEIDDLVDIVSGERYETRSAIFFEYQNKEKKSELSKLGGENKGNQIVEFRKINPTKYRLRIHNVTKDFPLVFSESFHEQWRAYLVENVNVNAKESNEGLLGEYKILDGNEEDQASSDELRGFVEKGLVTDLGDGKEKQSKHYKWNGKKEIVDYVEKYKVDFVSKNFNGTIQNDNLPKGKMWETWLAGGKFNNNVKQISENKHLMANGYANSWMMNVDELCGDGKMCQKNADGSYDMEVVVEFWPQRLFYVGLAISGFTLFGCLGYLGYDWRKRRREMIEKKKK